MVYELRDSDLKLQTQMSDSGSQKTVRVPTISIGKSTGQDMRGIHNTLDSSGGHNSDAMTSVHDVGLYGGHNTVLEDISVIFVGLYARGIFQLTVESN